MNHMEVINDKQEAAKPGCVYLPHHAVVREDKSTTKVRFVFDASCKGTSGKSLNDNLLVGPRLQPELRHIIMKWHTYPICFAADIVKMYRMVKVVPEHTDFQRVLWRENPSEEVKDCRLLRVTFGVSSAPYPAVKSLQQVAKDERSTGLSWDQEVTSNLLDEWISFRDNLPALNQVTVPRWVNKSKDTTYLELHGFSDGSNDAYSAVVYLRATDHYGNVRVSLITARTKVSPIKQISIPRLELCGAVLVARLLSEVSGILPIPASQIHAWTDSTIVLAWLKGQPNRWKTFVANRVIEILTVLNNDQWSHVESCQNPADCASRGLAPQEFIHCELWFHGPAFLRESTYVSPTVNISTYLKAKPLKSHHLTIAEVISRHGRSINLYQKRYKWTKTTPEPQIGDVVLVKEDGLPPSKWLFGLIEEKHTGPDNVTRMGGYYQM
uniref:DUF5641 domain-containing protein n=1 Tax=Bombyx mori TaxID=7091 RepID=A0A8R2R1D1_BOMMO|nr:uncharacterized protein LOC110386617 [Bombyx mori]